MISIRASLTLVLSLLAPSPSFAEDLAPATVRFLEATAHRAALMGPVAEAKAVLGQPIFDPAQEARVLAVAARDGAAQGLALAPYERFVAAQMALARGIQTRWSQPLSPPASPEAAQAALSDLRRAIAATTAAQLTALSQALPLLTRQEAAFREGLQDALRLQGAQDGEISALADAALALRFGTPAPEGLAALKARGTLRVGTTGDYAPFSYRTAEGTLAGIDIDLAQAFAESLGLELEWVETSWPTLTADLQRGVFDLALSGISRTLTRATVPGSSFSEPYHRGGKAPIIRCEDRTRFTTWEAIDQPGVRAVVNPGGTNEAFARSRYQHASLRIHEDNRTIFREIAEGRADVMVTDLIEVQLWAGRDSRLCPALGTERLTYAEKGAWLAAPPGSPLTTLFNLWLAQQQGSGALGDRFRAHGVGP